MKKHGTILLVVLAVLALGGCNLYNGLVDKSEGADKAWSDINAMLLRRADLVPNLVNAVKGYASHEKEIFENVAEARSKLLGAKTPAEAAEADAALSGVLGRLLAIAEAYPELKANENFLKFQDELAGTENRIAVARTDYNAMVKDYNASIRRLPASLIAGPLGFEKKDYFEPPAGAAVQQAPAVSF
ncbi:MAG: LemA family protein [Kiritimatiellae bacterium]|nr:LemA family protein [Kiritimatiellia bacterium]